MKILIAGATGLIGSEIREQLLKCYDVKSLSIDDFSDIRMDLSNFEEINNYTFDNYDIFINCAGVIDEEFKANSLKAYQRNTYGFDLLLRKILTNGTIKAVIYFSTSHVYGNFDKTINEDTPVNPLSDYAIAHYAAEQILKKLSINKEFKTFILRPNATYGIPRLINNFKRWQLIPFSFPIDCLQNHKITLNSSGYQKRNFISTMDLAGYVVEIINNMKSFDHHTVINPIGCNDMSVYEFAIKCCNIYQELSGIICTVDRSESLEKDRIDDFLYKSKHSFYTSKCSLDEFLQSFIKIIEEHSKQINMIR